MDDKKKIDSKLLDVGYVRWETILVIKSDAVTSIVLQFDFQVQRSILL